ncbi:MAG: hypothetical protein LQ341_007007, partial [Variospora aurantia]
MPLHPRTCSLLYSVSCLLDALDGLAARQFNQSTRFGAVLDMVTDRCTTSCLLVFLSSAFPRWALLFQGLISLDFASHYMHMYATLTMGDSGQSHKKIDQSRSRLLHLYYNNRTVLFIFCAMNELFFIAIYLLSFSSPMLTPSLLPTEDKAGSTAQPGSPTNPSSMIFATPGSAWAMELARANKMDSFWPWVLAGVSLPVMAGKQILNVVQLIKARPHHQLPRSASKPHDPQSSGGPSPAPLLGPTRDTTVVRIPLRSAKHHFGVSVSRGQRPYNEDTYQAGVIEIPAFAKRAPINLTRAPASSPLQAYREGQRKQQEHKGAAVNDGEGTSAESASGDPQVFYFGIFDGHGGTECSGFLKEKLHEYIEEAVQKYSLESTLGRNTNHSDQQKKKAEAALPIAEKLNNDSAVEVAGDGNTGTRLRASRDRATSFPTSDPIKDVSSSKNGASTSTPPSPPSSASTEDVSSLQKKLIRSWRETVGGYFRRFSPSAFALSPPTISTVLTHAFLAADLSFISAQLKVTASNSDPVLADSPINSSDIVAYDSPQTKPSHSSSQSNRQPSTPSARRTPFKGGSTAS